MMWILSFLGVGGVAAVGAFLFPQVALSLATSILDTVMTGAQKFLSTVLNGLVYICASKAAITTLGVCIVASAWLGPKFFDRPLPQIVYAQEAPVKAQRSYRHQKPAESDPIKSAWNEFSCNILASC